MYSTVIFRICRLIGQKLVAAVNRISARHVAFGLRVSDLALNTADVITAERDDYYYYVGHHGGT